MRLPPGQWSSQRHWHSAEDEFVWVVEGEVVLVEDGVEVVLRPGDCAGFKAGVASGHHLENRSDREAVLLEMGSRRPERDTCTYSDIDMVACGGGVLPASRRDAVRLGPGHALAACPQCLGAALERGDTPQGHVPGRCYQSRSRSLIEVFERVLASTVLTITAQ